MPSERLVHSIMVSHGLDYRPLEDFDNDYEKFMQWHIEQFRNRLQKDMRFLMAVDIMGIIGLITVMFVYAIS